MIARVLSKIAFNLACVCLVAAIACGFETLAYGRPGSLSIVLSLAAATAWLFVRASLALARSTVRRQR